MSDLLKAFSVDNIEENNITDYEIFKDKELLESLRETILEKIVESNRENYDREFVSNIISKEIEGYDLSPLERGHLYNLIENELSGYGPIASLMKDNEITEIMVNGIKDIYVEINGHLIKDESVSFINEDHIIRTIQKIIEPVGRVIDATNPMVDARLKDGSRLNAVIPPLSTKGPVMTIRKFKKNIISLEDLLRIGTVTPYMADFLDAAVRAKLNILICGGSGSGKTTLLNILSSSIRDDERIITIEDAAELNLNKPHVISLETRTDNYESKTNVTIRDLLINSLRMRPDRIIVGEVRGAEAYDMLWAMNTGHEGSLTTLHANSPKDALNRLESMVLMQDNLLPLNAIREYITNTIDLVVYIERLSDGKRKILDISEIKELKNGEITLSQIFAFNIKGITSNKEINGEYVKYDGNFKFIDKLHKKGINDIDYMFKK